MANITQKQINNNSDESDRFSWKDIPLFCVMICVCLYDVCASYLREEIIPRKYTMELVGVMYFGIIFFGRQYPEYKMSAVGIMAAPVVIGALIVSLFFFVEGAGDEDMFESDKSCYMRWTLVTALFGSIATILLYC